MVLYVLGDAAARLSCVRQYITRELIKHVAFVHRPSPVVVVQSLLPKGATFCYKRDRKQMQVASSQAMLTAVVV